MLAAGGWRKIAITLIDLPGGDFECKCLFSAIMGDNREHGLTARAEDSRMDAGDHIQRWD
jgi:hypothetical protein